MSLNMLVSGADCGPVNPLQGLAKRFEQDRGVQQVRGTQSRKVYGFTTACLIVMILPGLFWARTSRAIERGPLSIALLNSLVWPDLLYPFVMNT